MRQNDPLHLLYLGCTFFKNTFFPARLPCQSCLYPYPGFGAHALFGDIISFMFFELNKLALAAPGGFPWLDTLES
jgi:hypothetical protein